MISRIVSCVCFVLLLTPLGASAELIITEVMPAANGLQAYAEWFEVYNAGFAPRNLHNFEIRDNDGDSFTITEEISLPPRSFFVFGPSDDTAMNGCVSVDYVWSNFTLDDDADEIIIVNRVGEAFETFTYGGAGWEVDLGHAWYRQWYQEWMRSNLDCPECWGLDYENVYGCCGNYGTPGIQTYGVVTNETMTWTQVKALYR